MEEGGKACDSSSKSRGKGEELVDGCQFAMVHEEAPGLHVRSEILVVKDSLSSH